MNRVWKNNEQGILYLCAGVIFILTIVPRFVQIVYFLPDYFGDETAVTEAAFGFLSGDFKLYNQTYYGPFFHYLLAAVFWVQSFFHGGGAERFGIEFFLNPTPYYYTGRIFNSCLILATALFTYVFSREHLSKRASAILLLFVLFPFFDITVGFSVRIDTLMALLAWLGTVFCVFYLKTGQTRYFMIAGAIFGCDLAVKPLQGLLLCPTLGVTHFLRVLKDSPNPFSWGAYVKRVFLDVRGYVVLIVGAGVFICLNPSIIFELGEFLTIQKGVALYESARSYELGWNITRFIPYWGIPVSIALVAAPIYYLIRSLKQRDFEGLIFCVFPIIFWLVFINKSSRVYWYITMLPFVLFFLSEMIDGFVRKFVQNLKLQLPVILILLTLILWTPSMRLVNQWQSRLDLDLERHHTEIAGKKWIEDNIPSGSKIFMYGKRNRLPRIHDQDPLSAASSGLYLFLGNAYMENLFIRAHLEREKQGIPMYQVGAVTPRFSRKAVSPEVEKRMLKPLLEGGAWQYFISNYSMDHHPEMNALKLKAFSRDTYPHGTEFTLYKLD